MHGSVTRSQSPPPDAIAAPGGRLEAASFDLRELVRIVRRHILLIGVTAGAVVALAFLFTSQLRREYTATTMVVVDGRDSQVLGIDPGIAGEIGGAAAVDTEVEIAHSSKVLERVAAALDLTAWPDFAKSRSFGDLLGSLFGMEGAPPTNERFSDLADDDRSRLIEALGRHVDIRRVGLTNVIAMSATTYEAENSAKLANAVADAYLTAQIADKVGSNERAAGFLRARVDSLASEISSLETQIDDFVRNKVAQAGSVEAKALLSALDEQERQRQAKSQTLSQIQAAIDARNYDQLTQLLAAQEADLAQRRTALKNSLSGLTDESRRAAATADLSALDAELKNSADRQVNALKSDLALVDAQDADLRNRLTASLAQTQLPQGIAVELFKLQRDVDTNRTLYQTYLTKLRQIEQQTDFEVPDSRVIAAAMTPTRSSFPPTRLILGGSLVLALALGFGLAFLREHFIGGVTSEDQLEGLSGLPVVSKIPLFKGGRDEITPDRVVVAQPLSAFSESVRRIRLALDEYSNRGKLSILVTSSLPNEGKTTVALALARQYALSGISTVLIDADLRHPGVGRLAATKVEFGLIDYLTQPNSPIAFVKERETGLFLMPGSTSSAVATDALLLSSRFTDLLAFAKRKYDVVVIDTSPVGLVVDASIAARRCDVGLFVVRYGATGQTAVRSALRDLTRRVSMPVCAVLNQVAGSDDARYGSQRSYRAYYG